MARSIRLKPWTDDGVESLVKMEKGGTRSGMIVVGGARLYVTPTSPFPPPQSPRMEEEPYATRVLSTACHRPNKTRVTVADGETI